MGSVDLSCAPMGFIQSSDSKDLTKQHEPYEGLGICVITVYLYLLTLIQRGKLTFALYFLRCCANML